MKFLGVSGSLRRNSTNTALLEAMKMLAPDGIELSIYRELALIPAFNPDLEQTGIPEAVLRWRELLHDSDAVLFSTPEYAHGVPGSLKNALDWDVGSAMLLGKLVVLVNASHRSIYAQEGLREVLKTIGARFCEEASVTVNLLGKTLKAADIIADDHKALALRSSLESLIAVASTAIGRHF